MNCNEKQKKIIGVNIDILDRNVPFGSKHMYFKYNNNPIATLKFAFINILGEKCWLLVSYYLSKLSVNRTYKFRTVERNLIKKYNMTDFKYFTED